MPNDETQSDKGQAADDVAKSGVDPQELAKMVNAAVSTQLKRSLTGLPKLIKDAIAEAVQAKPVDGDEAGEQADPKTGAKKPAAPGAGGEAGAATGAQKTASDAMADELAALRKRLDKNESDLKDARKATAQAHRRAVEEKGYASVRSALAAKGLAEGPGLNAAIDLLRSRNQIVIDDDGNVKMKLRAEFERGLGEEERELALGEALPHYLKTPDAALFMPPPSRGAPRGPAHVPGQRPPARSSTGNTLADTLSAEAERLSGKPLNESLLT